MDSYLIPFFFFPHTTHSHLDLLPFNYAQTFPIIAPTYGNSFSMEKDLKNEDSSKQTKKQDFEISIRAVSRKKSGSNSQKGDQDNFSALPLSEQKDKKLEIKSRQQTANRNLGSNTLKIYFKQLRDSNSETFLNLQKIILMAQAEISTEKFMERLNKIFPQNATYICFHHVKGFCSNFKANENQQFAKIFRISFKRFFKYQIFAVHLKSVRTTRQIRNQQIQQGKIFLQQLFH